MGMGPLFPFLSWVWFKRWQVLLRYKLAGLESRFVEIDDGKTIIHCWVPKTDRDEDDLRPALLLIHGFGMDGTFGWENQVRTLAKKFRLYVPDLLFFGKSTTEKSDACTEEAAGTGAGDHASSRSEFFQGDCFKAMLDVLKVDQVNIVGTSYGGIVGYHMACRYPKLVSKLVVASCGIMMNPRTNDNLMKLAKINDIKEILLPRDARALKVGYKLATVMWIWMLPTFVLQDIYDVLTSALDKNVRVQWFYDQNKKERAELVDGMITGSHGAPPVPVVSQDVLILWGTKDVVFQPDLAEQLKRHVGERASVVYIQGGGHVPQTEFPRKFNTHVMNFLTS